MVRNGSFMNLMGNKTDLSDPVGTAAEALCRYCEVIYSNNNKNQKNQSQLPSNTDYSSNWHRENKIWEKPSIMKWLTTPRPAAPIKQPTKNSKG